MIRKLFDALPVEACHNLAANDKGRDTARAQFGKFHLCLLVTIHIPDLVKQTAARKKLLRCSAVWSGLC